MDTCLITEALNPEQRKAVELESGNLLVLAGAGTGKTRVLTSRVAWLVSQGLAHAGEILAVTFTNKASQEMLVRIADLLNRDDVSGMWMGTFHSVAYRLLRYHGREIGIGSGFQVIDKSDQTSIIRRLLKEDKSDYSSESVRDLSGFISRSKEWGLHPGDIQSDHRNRKWLPYYEMYNEYIREQNKLDFGDLMILSRDLLIRHPGVRRQYAERFRHVLVDEFQDTSRFQYDWLKLFKSDGNRFFAVGDDDQSIYGFRSADPYIMQEYRKEFGVTEIVRLETNYRSQPNVLKVANALISRNSGRIGKTLKAHAGTPEPLRLRGFGHAEDEARFVANSVQSLGEEGVANDSVAVIYRTNAQRRLIEQMLVNLGIPYRVYGGQRFFDRKEIKDAMCYLRLAVNPHDRDALTRVINFPPRGIGARTMERLAENPNGIHAAIQMMAQENPKVDGFRMLLEDLVRAHEGNARPSEMVLKVNGVSGLHKHYSQKGEDLERGENLDELVNAAKQFENQTAGKDASLADFISYASLDTGNPDAQEQSAVNLMTAHAAKGLEFEVVFLVGLQEGLFPHYLSKGPHQIEEERRLMYVAITRAKRLLFLTYARSRMERGQRHESRQSRFLDELPPDVIEEYSAIPGGGGERQVRRQRKNPAFWSTRTRNPGNGRTAPEGIHSVGTQVEHSKFGKGVVLAVRKTESREVVEIYFKSCGRKKIDSSVVKMKIT